MTEDIFQKYKEQLSEYEGIEVIILLDKDGNVLIKSSDIDFSDIDGREFLDSWRSRKSSINFLNFRYAILKNDELQLAAKNIAQGKGNIAGSKTKNGNYLIVHISKETGMILLEWAILVNKVGWS